MGWYDKNPSTNRPWTDRVHQDTPQMILDFATAIKLLIQNGNGKFTGRYFHILKAAGYNDTYYANLFHNIGKIKTKYNITSKRAGIHGSTYM